MPGRNCLLPTEKIIRKKLCRWKSTTSIRTQHPPNERVPWDWRILLNGKGDEMLYERHFIVTDGLPFAELKSRSLINARARAANDSPGFSKLIREGLPLLPEPAIAQ